VRVFSLMTKTPDRKKRKNKQKEKKSYGNDLVSEPLATFFAQYRAFDYCPNASSSKEFYRMCDHFDWYRHDRERAEAHEDFKTALVQQFNTLYGTEVDDIAAWRGLCLALEGRSQTGMYPPTKKTASLHITSKS